MMGREVTMTAVALISFLLWIMLAAARKREYAEHGMTAKLAQYTSYTYGVVSCGVTSVLLLIGINLIIGIPILLVGLVIIHTLFHKKHPWLI